MKSSIVLILGLLSFSTWGTVVSGANDCPTQFEGKVKEVIEPIGPSSTFSMNKVIIENVKTLKGEVGSQVLLDVLQNGPFEVKANKDYLVQLRKGKLCWIEEI